MLTKLFNYYKHSVNILTSNTNDKYAEMIVSLYRTPSQKTNWKTPNEFCFIRTVYRDRREGGTTAFVDQQIHVKKDVKMHILSIFLKTKRSCQLALG